MEDDMSELHDEKEKHLQIESNKESDSSRADVSDGKSLLRSEWFEELGLSYLALADPSKMLFLEGDWLGRVPIATLIWEMIVG